MNRGIGQGRIQELTAELRNDYGQLLIAKEVIVNDCPKFEALKSESRQARGSAKLHKLGSNLEMVEPGESLATDTKNEMMKNAKNMLKSGKPPGKKSGKGKAAKKPNKRR